VRLNRRKEGAALLTRSESSLELSERIVFLDVDTQVDFIDPQGSLYMPHAASITGNLKRLVDYALEHRLLLLQATDAHVVNDPEFTTFGFPSHCVVGTLGHQRIDATAVGATLVLPNRAGAYKPPLGTHRVVRVEKQAFSVGSNPNFAALIDDLGPCHVIAFGVATEGCVKQSVLSLLKLGVPVSIVIDAVGHANPASGEATLEELASLGVRPVSTDDACNGLLGVESEFRVD
jgi:nicotinamidase/pyrazinamidase